MNSKEINPFIGDRLIDQLKKKEEKPQTRVSDKNQAKAYIQNPNLGCVWLIPIPQSLGKETKKKKKGKEQYFLQSRNEENPNAKYIFINKTRVSN